MSFTPYPLVDAFECADAFLAKGRNKNRRPLGKNTHLIRVDADTIAVRLHNTAVVTYHRDTTMTIYGGGWNTVITKSRINEYSAARVGSDGNGSWVVGHTGEVTPPKIQKCRQCKQTEGRAPRWSSHDYCSGPCTWGSTYCRGGETKYAVEAVWDLETHRLANLDQHLASRYIEPCQHGEENGHATEPCHHGQWERHSTGITEKTCWGCHGTGLRDYGSKPVPIIVDASQPFVVDASGAFLRMADTAPSQYAMPSPKKSLDFYSPPCQTYSYVKPAPTNDAFHYGSEVTTRLAEVVPGLRNNAKHPVDGARESIISIIINLNDTHKWSRERIADWLDTLETDLRFPAAS